MSAHCNTCGDDLAWDLTCGRCEMTADRDRWKRLALDMGEQLMIENEKHPNHNITKLLVRLDGIANKEMAE